MTIPQLLSLLSRCRDLLGIGVWDNVEDELGNVVGTTCTCCGSDVTEPHEDDCDWSNTMADVDDALGPELPCANCGDASGWARVRINGLDEWAACADCNDEGAKPKPAFCLKCSETFPFCRCRRGES